MGSMTIIINNNKPSVVPKKVGFREDEMYTDLTSTSMKVERLFP